MAEQGMKKMAHKPTYEELEEKIRQLEREKIPSKKEVSSALDSNQSMIQELIDLVPMPIFYKDDKGRYLGGNRTWLDKVVGLSLAEVKGKTLFELPTATPAELAKRYHDQDMHLIHNPGTQVYEAQVKHSDGELRDYIFNKATLQDEQGEVTGIVGIMQDITKRRETEKKLMQSQERYKGIFEGSMDAIFLTAREGNIIEINQSALDLFGYSRDEILEINANETYADPVDRKKYKGLIEAQGYVRDFGVNLRKKDGTVMECLINASVWHKEDGSVGGYQGIIRDMTEIRKAEHEFRKMEKLEALTTFSGGVAHNMNNLLSIVFGGIDITKAAIDPKVFEDTSMVYEALDDAKYAADRIHKLTKLLLTFSQRSSPSLQNFPISKTVRDSVAYSGKELGDGIEYDIRMPSGELLVEHNPYDLMNVLFYIYRNASEAMDGNGTIYVDIDRARVEKPNGLLLDKGDYARISVHDHGKGIEKDNISKVFDPFYTTKMTVGHGLELSAARTLIRNHDGNISVESEPGKGTVFHLYLPLTAKQDA